jgi:cell division protein FtsL
MGAFDVKLLERMLQSRMFTPIALVLAALLTVGLYATKTETAALRERVASHKQAIADGKLEKNALRAEAQMLETPARIESLAARQLNMRPPPPPPVSETTAP